MNTINRNTKHQINFGTALFLYLVCLLWCLSIEVNVAKASSIVSPELERYLRTVTSRNNNGSTLSTPIHNVASSNEDRILMDVHTYAFLNYSFLDENEQCQNVTFNEEKARYGEGKILSVRGELVHISDAMDVKDDSACSSDIRGTRGKPLPINGVNWVALVRRGQCTFEEKVKNVHAKGAIGVIIYNDRTVLHLEKMQIKGKTRNITAVITYQDIGERIVKLLDRNMTINMTIIEGRSVMRTINTLNKTSVLFVAISFIILMVISLVWLIFYYIQKFRYMQTKDQQSRHLCSMTKKAIMKIPTKTGKLSEDKDSETDCCAICIEAYKPADLIRVLPCKHEFHKSCIDPWLIEHRTCPMCKLDVLKFYGFTMGGEESQVTAPPAHLLQDAALNGTGRSGDELQRSMITHQQQQTQQQQQYYEPTTLPQQQQQQLLQCYSHQHHQQQQQQHNHRQHNHQQQQTQPTTVVINCIQNGLSNGNAVNGSNICCCTSTLIANDSGSAALGAISTTLPSAANDYRAQSMNGVECPGSAEYSNVIVVKQLNTSSRQVTDV